MNKHMRDTIAQLKRKERYLEEILTDARICLKILNDAGYTFPSLRKFEATIARVEKGEAQ